MSVGLIRLRVFSPLQVVLVSSALYLFVFLTAPVTFRDVGSAAAVGTLAAFLAFLLVGMGVGAQRLASTGVRVRVDIEKTDWLKWALAIVGIVGLALRVYDRLVLRSSAAMSGDFIENRQMIEESGSGPVSIVAAFLAPLLFYVPVPVLLLRAAGERRRSDFVFFALSAGYAAFDAALFGSRSSALILVSIALVAYLSVTETAIRPSTVILGLLGFLGFVWVSGAIFWARINQMGLDPSESLRYSAAGYMVIVDPRVMALFDSTEGGYQGLVFAYLSFCQYMLHGVFEFLNLVETFSREHTYGAQSFYVPAKVLWKLSGNTTSIEQFLMDNMDRPGVYSTFFGPMFYDYGSAGGALACGVFGFLSGRLSRGVANGSLHLLLPYVLVMAFLPFLLIVNLFTGGTGQCLIIAAVPFVFLLNRDSFRWGELVDEDEVDEDATDDELTGDDVTVLETE